MLSAALVVFALRPRRFAAPAGAAPVSQPRSAATARPIFRSAVARCRAEGRRRERSAAGAARPPKLLSAAEKRIRARTAGHDRCAFRRIPGRRCKKRIRLILAANDAGAVQRGGPDETPSGLSCSGIVAGQTLRPRHADQPRGSQRAALAAMEKSFDSGSRQSGRSLRSAGPHPRRLSEGYGAVFTAEVNLI